MSWLELLVAVASVLAADQLSKRHVLAQPRFATAGAAPRSYIAISIRCIINRRASLVPMSETWIVAGWIVCVALAFFALDQEPLAESPLGAAGVGMALGGVTGNVIDLLWRRGVVDFIAIGSWTICNIADLAIVGGLAMTVWALV
jgi:lipoprotein signal peptidase